MSFLPISKKDLDIMGIDTLDFICITGDSYVDHPSFGIAIISRVIEASGYTVGIISQPTTQRDYSKLGQPRYGFFVTAGNIDSMVAHYTVSKKRRTDDPYTVGNKAGKRPDRATCVYCNSLKDIYPNTPIIIGGIEASLRRFAHYDYWADKVLPSILEDSHADILTYGMGERQTIEICKRLSQGENIKTITDIRGTCVLVKPQDTPLHSVECPSFDVISHDNVSYAKAVKRQVQEQDEVIGRTVIQRQTSMMLVQNPPMQSLTTKEFDWVYSLPYERYYHPCYEPDGVKAIEEVEFSITHNRGCFGGCNFCSITLHQGRKITNRSEQSILKEAKEFTKNPRFKGYIHDVGGPTANFRHPSCEKQKELGLCKDKLCLAPTPCKLLDTDHSEYLGILRKLRAIDGVKKVFIRSGIRYDYLLLDDSELFNEIIEHHISGQLKVAPEHCAKEVLLAMGKSPIEVYEEFSRRFYGRTKSIGKEQYLIPYLMSSHPQSTINSAIELALFLKRNNIKPQQVQDFYPTPGTISTCMYYTKLDPYTLKPVYVAKDSDEKELQRALLQYYKMDKKLIVKALHQAKRLDLAAEFGVKEFISSSPTNAKHSDNKRSRSSSKERDNAKGGTSNSKGRNGRYNNGNNNRKG